MKRTSLIVLMLVLLAGVLPAAAKQKSKSKSGRKNRVHATSKKSAAPKTAKRSPEMQAVVVLLSEQQQQIQSLRDEMTRLAEERQKLEHEVASGRQTAENAGTQATAAQTAAGQSADSLNKLDKAVADLKADVAKAATERKEETKKVASTDSILSRFRFHGDARVRYENFFQAYDGCTTCSPRHRPRMRIRFGVEGKLNEDLVGGFYIATGGLNDPISTNETFGNFFGRKPIGLDRAWITYQPQRAKWLQLTGGKFAYTWKRTPLTFDGDLNPEGFSEKFSFDIKNDVVRNVTFVGMQLYFNEVSTGADSFAVGGQASTRLQLGKRIILEPSVTVLNWRNADAIAAAITAKGISGNALTNATNPAKTAYLSKFLYSDYMLDASIRTPWEKLPLRVVFNYEKNLRAVGDQDSAWMWETTLGKTKEKGDIQFGYSYWHIEQDAVIAAFNESDLRAGTNVAQHRFSFQYQIQKNTTVSYSLWLGNTLDRTLQNAAVASGLPAGEEDPRLARMQFDLIYKF